MECIWSAETGFGSHPGHKRSCWPRSSTVRPRLTLDRFGPGGKKKRPRELVCTIYKSPLQQLEHSAQENANLKHSVSPGAYHCCSGPRTNGKFGANASGDDCTPHRAGKYTKSSGSPGLSTAITFIHCGFAIFSCGLTSISAIAATAFDKNCKWPK